MDFETNRAREHVSLENAFTNNTFSLKETENAIQFTILTSFHYLMELERLSMNISRFNLDESYIYDDEDGYLCISVDKDFIESTIRKRYKESKYFDKYLSLKDILSNPQIFMFVPQIFLDGKVFENYEVKCALDGRTDFRLHGIGSMQSFKKTSHLFEVVFWNRATSQAFATNLNVLDKYDYKMPRSLTDLTYNQNDTLMVFLADKDYKNMTNLYPAKMDQDGNLILDKDNPSFYNYVQEKRDVIIKVIKFQYLHELEGYKKIQTRKDAIQNTCMFVVPQHNLPIPTQNIIILRKNKSTGEYRYINNVNFEFHYPNIYEFYTNDLDKDEYEYSIYYFYYGNSDQKVKYDNKIKFLEDLIERKANDTLENGLSYYLYNENLPPEDEDFSNMLLRFIAHVDTHYIYNLPDFFTKVKPYDFDYKVNTMREYIDTDANILRRYANRVKTPLVTFYLDLQNIDLTNRVRMDSLQEKRDSTEEMYFVEPHYIFFFQNIRNEVAGLRFFIDGYLYNRAVILQHDDISYVYIPVKDLTPTSHIEIEQFEKYVYKHHHTFRNHDDPLTIDFPKREFIIPTLYDLYMVDSNGKKLDRSDFQIFALVNKEEYDITDKRENVPDNTMLIRHGNFYTDPVTNELYLELDTSIYDEETETVLLDAYDPSEHVDDRLPLKYHLLNKIKIFCSEPSYLNKDITVTITKIPYMRSQRIMEDNETPQVVFMKNMMPWNMMKSYIRTFVNGRFVNLDYRIKRVLGSMYFQANAKLNLGDVLTVDITPFSYDLIYKMDEIPDNFLITFGDGTLEAPFDLRYYDAYLNGQKLTDDNVCVLTANKIQLYNVHSRHNFYVFKRDRDVEFYGYQSAPKNDMDIFFESGDITPEDKKDVIDHMIRERNPGKEIHPGDDTNHIIGYEKYPEDEFDYITFFNFVIALSGVYRPNTKEIDTDEVKNEYPSIYHDFVELDPETGKPVTGRIVIRPNVHRDTAKKVLMLGKGIRHINEDPGYADLLGRAIDLLEKFRFDLLFNLQFRPVPERDTINASWDDEATFL